MSCYPIFIIDPVVGAIKALKDFCYSSESGKHWWLNYFQEYWVDDDWPLLWSDVRRHEHGATQRLALWHTNNITENMIRRLGP